MKRSLFILSLFLIVSCCTTKPPEYEGINENCRAFFWCMYYNSKNSDKSICANLAEGCKQANDFNSCTKSEKVDFKDCLLLLKK